MVVIHGKPIARSILLEQKKLIEKHRLSPKLVTLLIGNNEASRIYIREKQKKAKHIGIEFENVILDEACDEETLTSRIRTLNRDGRVSAILVQLPLPKTINPTTIVQTIAPDKDADGFHPDNIEKFLALPKLDNLLDSSLLLPVTPAAIFEILATIPEWQSHVKEIGFVGRHSIFTTPLIHFFTKHVVQHSFSFSVIDPRDPELSRKTSSCDLLIVAAGRPATIIAPMIKKGAIIIDVGINRKDGAVVGDVAFDEVAPKTSYITPVVGGVGPVTVAVLLRNVVYAALNR